MTHPTSTGLYGSSVGIGSTQPFIEIFKTYAPTPQDINGEGGMYQVQQRWWDTATNNEWVLVGFIPSNGVVSANWQEVSSGSDNLETLSDDVSTIVTPLSNNIQLVGHVNEQNSTKFSTVVAGTHLLNINPMSCARWIVDPLGFNGTHTTIRSAITSATSGDTIFIMPGIYTENPTLKAGVNLTAFNSDSNNISANVTINGTCSFSAAGSVALSGIQFQTNSAAALSITGSAASIVTCDSCYFDCTNSTGIVMSSSSPSAFLTLQYCKGNIENTGIAVFNSSSAGIIYFQHCLFFNTGVSTTPNTVSAGSCFFNFGEILNPISISGTAGFGAFNSYIAGNGGSTALSASTSGVITCSFTTFDGGASTAITIATGSTVQLINCSVSSSATNCISGLGTLNYQGLAFPIVGSTSIAASVQTGGTLFGSVFQNPSAGFVGEQIRSAVASGSAITLTNATPANVTSISLTAGVWDVSGIVEFIFAAASTSCSVSVNGTSATLGTLGDNAITNTYASATNPLTAVVLPAYRVMVTTPTTYYLVAQAAFATGATAYGRISATRVG